MNFVLLCITYTNPMATLVISAIGLLVFLAIGLARLRTSNQRAADALMLLTAVAVAVPIVWELLTRL